MEFHRLPDRRAGAAENMATDFLLLRRAPGAPCLRLRHYDWHRPAWTFGYTQQAAFVRAQLPAGAGLELMRRPTGGGVVDHRHDWTYALVLPRGHALEAEPAPRSYRAVHAAVRDALGHQGVPAVLEEEAPDDAGAGVVPGVCFTRAEISDVVDPGSRRKLAGAAQKRTREGLLFQGSIDRTALGPGGAAFDWERFYDDFTAALGRVLAATPGPHAWPELNDEELAALAEQYATPDWLELR